MLCGDPKQLVRCGCVWDSGCLGEVCYCLPALGSPGYLHAPPPSPLPTLLPPAQGPVVRSAEAAQAGLAMSLLEVIIQSLQVCVWVYVGGGGLEILIELNGVGFLGDEGFGALGVLFILWAMGLRSSWASGPPLVSWDSVLPAGEQQACAPPHINTQTHGPLLATCLLLLPPPHPQGCPPPLSTCVMLVRNYRSHSRLLDLPSRLFYGGSLLAAAPVDSVQPPVWDELQRGLCGGG